MMSVIETYTGKQFDVSNPSVDDIDIVDIAHSLSQQCRFNGHCRKFYSVAQHSLFVVDIVRGWGYSGKFLLASILHDAAEAYIGDIPRPIKNAFPFFKEVENRIFGVILSSLGLSFGESVGTVVLSADNTALTTEAKELMFSGGVWWDISEADCPTEPPLHLTIDESESRFLEEFHKHR